MIRLAGTSSNFQWSTTPQLYPFEKAKDGQDVYARYYSASSANANSTITHGITNLPSKLVRIWGTAKYNASENAIPLPYAENGGTQCVRVNVNATSIFTNASDGSFPALNITMYVLYTLNNIT